MEPLTIFWKFFTEAHKPENARRVYDRVVKVLDVVGQSVRIEPYIETGGHTVAFTSQLESSDWPQAIVRVLEQAQRIGYGWTLSGRILEELDIGTNRTSLGGVTMFECRVERSATDS